LGRLYDRGHGDEAWRNDDNLFTTTKPDPVSGGFTLLDGLTAFPPVDYFGETFTSAGFTTAATSDAVAAYYAAALGGSPVYYWTWAGSFYTSCLAGSGNTTGRCAFEPLVGQINLPEDDKTMWVIEGGDTTPVKLVLVHFDRNIGKTMVRLAWRAPTALPVKLPDLPDDQSGSSKKDGGVAIDAPLVGGAQSDPAQGNGPRVTNKKSSGCQIAGASGHALLPTFVCLTFLLLGAARRKRKNS
jgi:hypothetical protein